MKIYCFFLLFCLFLITSHISAQTTTEYDNWEVQFVQDTAKVEQRLRDNPDYSTLGMIEATKRYQADYDALLNKYYKLLLNTLNEEEKKVLKETQRNWIKLRDSDTKLVWTLKTKAYTDAGGGTIWGVVAVSAEAEITRRRVFELYNFLRFADLGGR